MTNARFANSSTAMPPCLLAAALRQVRRHDRAQDAPQIVFILLAQRAHHVAAHQRLTGWLFNALQFTVKRMQRDEQMRLKHEKRIAQQTQTARAPAPREIAETAEILDCAVARLPRHDREATLLRFYRNMPFDRLAPLLQISEAAAC